jgi:hypothetical protein
VSHKYELIPVDMSQYSMGPGPVNMSHTESNTNQVTKHKANMIPWLVSELTPVQS